MDEHQLKGFCYNCDEKYFLGHKCKEQKIFMAISKDISEEDVESPLVSESPEITDITPPLDPPKVEPVISLNALIRLLHSPNPQVNRLHQASEGHHSG
jgi:hypothetical protein